MRGWDTEISVLHVDDNPEVASLTAEYLQRENDRLEVEVVTSAEAAIERLEAVDCVISDYDMPGATGIEFLETVRERHPDLPFILFTGKGSEDVASRAISAGVTDYLRKETGTDQYTLLANRIANAVGQYRAEQVAQRSETRLRKLIDRIPHPIYVVDEEGRYLLSNEAHAAGHDMTAGEIEGSLAEDVLEPAFYESFREDMTAVLESGEPNRVPEVANHSGDGPASYFDARLYPFDAFGTDERVVLGVVIDITERKRRETTLERLNAVTRDLIEAESEREVAQLTVDALQASLDYQYTLVRLVSDDGTKLRPVAQSPAVQELLGSRPTYAVGEGPPGRAFADGETVVVGDVQALDDEFDRGNARASLYTPIGEHGVLSIGEDEPGVFDDWDVHVAEVFAANATVALDLVARETERQREHDRLEEFTSIVSHDLRTPLTVVSTALDLAERDGDPEYFERGREAVDRMDRLISDLLALARQGELVSERSRVSLADLAESCWTDLPTAEATLEIETTATVQADRARLRQLLENLFGNALEHAGPDVTVTVTDTADGFAVVDDGPGLETDTPAQVFESGYSTADDGTGFGLAIVRRIAEAHGWDVGATEAGTGGARFVVSEVDATPALREADVGDAEPSRSTVDDAGPEDTG